MQHRINSQRIGNFITTLSFKSAVEVDFHGSGIKEKTTRQINIHHCRMKKNYTSYKLKEQNISCYNSKVYAISFFSFFPLLLNPFSLFRGDTVGEKEVGRPWLRGGQQITLTGNRSLRWEIFRGLPRRPAETEFIQELRGEVSFHGVTLSGAIALPPSCPPACITKRQKWEVDEKFFLEKGTALAVGRFETWKIFGVLWKRRC